MRKRIRKSKRVRGLKYGGPLTFTGIFDSNMPKPRRPSDAEVHAEDVRQAAKDLSTTELHYRQEQNDAALDRLRLQMTELTETLRQAKANAKTLELERGVLLTLVQARA